MQVLDLGRMSYSHALERQLACWEQVREGGEDTLILVEHDPVLTLGANFHPENLLFPRKFYESRGIEVVPTDRGGDVTYHGPGQFVMYPIFDLTRRGRDLHRWLRALEQTQIDVLTSFGLTGRHFPPHTGVWIGDQKVAAIGIKVRRWINLHGIALNVSNDLAIYDLFVPCGIREFGVTSLEQELVASLSLDDVRPAIVSAFHALERGAASI